ncbi:MAG: hypothetical protein LBH43_18145, partial [Treponema sp.]|nr:hypothetical protein [Treponema sp.]
MAEAFSFAVDTSEFQKLAKTLKLTPKELQKPVARLLGDMAYDFKAQAPDVLEGVYTIRDKGFVKNKAFAVKRPKASDPIDSQEAVAAS